MNIIWGNSPKQHLQPLIVAQKKTIRTIKYRTRYFHTNADFLSLGFLKLRDINSYCASVFTYKSLNNLTFPTNYFDHVANTNNYNLRNALNLRLPQVGSTQSQLYPKYYCCHIWNNLPPYIRSRPSVASFKLATKKRLLEFYEDE